MEQQKTATRIEGQSPTATNPWFETRQTNGNTNLSASSASWHSFNDASSYSSAAPIQGPRPENHNSELSNTVNIPDAFSTSTSTSFPSSSSSSLSQSSFPSSANHASGVSLNQRNSGNSPATGSNTISLPISRGTAGADFVDRRANGPFSQLAPTHPQNHSAPSSPFPGHIHLNHNQRKPLPLSATAHNGRPGFRAQDSIANSAGTDGSYAKIPDGTPARGPVDYTNAAQPSTAASFLGQQARADTSTSGVLLGSLRAVQPGPSTASVPSQAPATGSPSEATATPNDGGAGNSAAKPILKMKRTGQAVTLPSVASRTPLRTPSLHQRNSPSSHSRKSGSPPTRKTSDSPQATSRVTGASLLGREADVQTMGRKPATENPPKAILNGQPSVALNAPSWKASESLVPASASGPQQKNDWVDANKPDRDSKAVGATEYDTDDDIRYEVAAHNTGLDDTISEIFDSSEESSSGSDDDGSGGSLTEEKTSLRQLFRPPGQDSDGLDEDDGDTEVDYASSVSSSSGGSSIANEPTVALPSANIQHQEIAPETILEMATSDRPYKQWSDDGGSSVNGSPAIFPGGYQLCQEISGFPWICAVRSCRKVYPTLKGLSNHFRFSHKGETFNDNLDGTLSRVGTYNKKNAAGAYPAAVVSKRPLDSSEPPMLEPMKALHFSKQKTISHKGAAEDFDFGITEEMAPGPSTLPLVSHPGSSEEMWEYVRPFLKVHTSIPEKNWVRQVIGLPRVRELQWNEVRQKEFPYKDSHPRDITALIVQITGVESPEPCKSCVQGKGPFKGCIMLSPEAPTDAQAAVLSCANCYYHCCQSLCSLCSSVIYRRERRAQLLQNPPSYNVKHLSDQARGLATPTAATTRATSSLQKTSLSAGGFARPNTKIYHESDITPIEMASADRPYKMIKGKDGELISMCGALVPENYDLDHNIAGRPWICPIRSCRHVFKRITGLGAHFCRKHVGALLNDNQDGTLSQLGVYAAPLPGHVHCAPFVISVGPLDPKEPPMEPARVPSSKEPGPSVIVRERHKSASLEVAKPKPKLGPTVKGVSQENIKATSSGKEMWDYMLPFMPQTVNCIEDSRILTLFGLPRLRNVKWRSSWKPRKLRDNANEIRGFLMQVSGQDYLDGSKCCTLCARGEGPFRGCYVVPPDAPFELHAAIRCCANCMFSNHSGQCSIKGNWEGRCATKPIRPSATANPVAEWVAAANQATHGNKRRRISGSGSDSEDGLRWRDLRRRSQRLQGSEDEGNSATSTKIVTMSLRNNEPALKARTSASGTARAAAPSALIQAGQAQPDNLLEMEDWEIAPGRIRESGAERINNIAFSKSYLEGSKEVRVSAEVSFRVDTIKSGHSLQLEADSTQTRYCSLASGKLHVSVEGQPDFTIGPHGLFKVMPGSKATVQNRLYIDSVLHISMYAEG